MFTRETFEALDDTELSTVRGLVNDVYQKRMDAKNASDEISRNLQILQDTHGIARESGAPWTQPAGAHDVYGMHAEVVHKGGRWRSKHPYNSWEPGTADLWERVGDAETGPGDGTVPLDDYPTWKPGIAVKPGDLYAYEGGLYQTIQAHTTQADWAPDLVPALWKKVG